MSTLGIVITYRETELCKKAIRSLVDAGADVALVFNGWDNKYRRWLDSVKHNLDYVFLNRQNLGFCIGNNQAMRVAIRDNYDYVFLLNNDAWVESDCIQELEKTLSKYSKVGLAQPKVYKAWNRKLLDTTGHIFTYGDRYSWEKGLGILKDRGEYERDEGQYDCLVDIPSCCGCAVMYRVEMLKDVGLFWERLWSICEDVELSWRAHTCGWKARFAPEAISYHWRGYTSLKNDRKKIFKKQNFNLWRYLFYRNWILILRRYGSEFQKKFEMLRFLILSLKCSIGSAFKLSTIDGKFIYLCSKAIFDNKYLNIINRIIVPEIRRKINASPRKL